MARRTLCGVVKSLDDRCVLDPHDVVVVSLCDITLWEWTRIDFPHIPKRYIVSKVKIDGSDLFPVPFTLYYDGDEIDSNLCYGLRCDILDKDDEVKYTSDRFIPVLTDKYPKTNVHITVMPCPSVPTTTTTTTTKNTDDDD